MSKLKKLLDQKKLTLIAEVPENDLELAAIATAAGADVLLLRINTHALNDLEAEKENLEKVLASTKIPVGLSAGWEKLLGKKEVAQICSLGFDFINIGIEHLSSSTVGLKKIGKVLKLNSRFSLDDIVDVARDEYVAMDAAIIPTSGWGKDLVVGDLQNYISIVMSAGLPVIIPTQKAIKPSEVSIVADTGVKGLILTPIVFGSSAKHVKQIIGEFKTAARELEE